MVTHALQVDDDVEHGDDGAEVARQGLLGGDDLQARVLDLVAFLVDLRIVCDDLMSQIHIALPKRLDAPLDGHLNHAGQRQHLLLDLGELSFKSRTRHEVAR